MLRNTRLRITIACLLFFVCTAGLNAQTEIDSLRRLVAESSGTDRVDQLFVLSKVLTRIDLDEAWELANLGIEESDSLDYGRGKTKGRLTKASVFVQQRNAELAYKQLMEAEALSKERGEELDLVDFNATLGNVYILKGELDKALEAFLEALDLAESSSSMAIQASCILNISAIHQKVGNFDKAADYMSRAIVIYEEEGMQLQIGQAYLNYGALEFQRQNFGVSVEFSEKAIEVFRKMDAKPNLALGLANLGFLYTSVGKTKEAFKCYDESMSIREELKDYAGIGVLHLNKAQTLRAQKNMNQAISEAKKAMVLAKENNHGQLVKNTYKFLSEAYEATGNGNKALESFKSYTLMKDSIAEITNRGRVQQLMANFEFEKKERELDASNENLKNAQKEQALYESRQQLLLIGLVLLLVVIGLLLLSYKSYISKARLKQKYLSEKSRNSELLKVNLQKELTLKENDLKDYLEKIQQKNDLISDIEDKLVAFEKEGSLSIKGKNISELARSVERKVIRSITWEEFRLKFDEVHKSFAAELMVKHAELTNNELDICILLKINLTNKEIAQTLNMSYDSVKKSLQRLYRKLELNSNEELRVYVFKF